MQCPPCVYVGLHSYLCVIEPQLYYIARRFNLISIFNFLNFILILSEPISSHFNSQYLAFTYSLQPNRLSFFILITFIPFYPFSFIPKTTLNTLYVYTYTQKEEDEKRGPFGELSLFSYPKYSTNNNNIKDEET